MKHDDPQNLFEALENVHEARVEFVKTVKAVFWQDVARVKEYFKQRRKRRALKRIRGTLTSFGIVTAHMTDDELEEHILLVAKHTHDALQKFGVSCAEAARAFEMLGQALRQYDRGPHDGIM